MAIIFRGVPPISKVKRAIVSFSRQALPDREISYPNPVLLTQKGSTLKTLINKKPPSGVISFIGAPGGSRTPDTRLRKPVLYPAELQAHKSIKLKYVAMLKNFQ